MTRYPALLIMLVALGAAVPAAASNPVAEQLFQDAVTLMEVDRYAEACPKLEQSQKLEPRSGTLLNLAYCHEKVGRTATAWTEYKDAVALAGTEGRPENADKANAFAAELEPKLSRLRIDVAPGALEVTIDVDGVAAVPGASFPVDPGEHVVTARAEGKQDWSTRVMIGSLADSKTVTVPELVPGTAPPVAPPLPAPDTGQRTGVPVWAWISGAAGLALIGVAIGFAVDQRAAAGDLEAGCGEDRQGCPPDYDFDADYDRERRDFGLFIGLGAGGVVALGVGVVGIVLGATSRPATTGAVRFYLGPAAFGIRGEL